MQNVVDEMSGVWYTAAQLASALGTTQQTVRNWLEAGKIVEQGRTATTGAERTANQPLFADWYVEKLMSEPPRRKKR